MHSSTSALALNVEILCDLRFPNTKNFVIIPFCGSAMSKVKKRNSIDADDMWLTDKNFRRTKYTSDKIFCHRVIRQFCPTNFFRQGTTFLFYNYSSKLHLIHKNIIAIMTDANIVVTLTFICFLPV